ncbi:MAG TPA: protein kinase [Vicinamibacteria bacterium]|nr:protein kinase [Vicinamibacteria bacterium]
MAGRPRDQETPGFDKRKEWSMLAPRVRPYREHGVEAEGHLANLGPSAVLGHFKIEEVIGAGGMGVVFRARDLRLGREVALKVLNEKLFENQTARIRFLREARLAARIAHPNIATIHEVDQQSGSFFIAMELVPGEDLKSRLLNKPLSVEEIASFGRQACDALEAAHTNGVIHRDIKSANIMITPSGQVKLLDFGLAKPLFENTDDSKVSGPPTPIKVSAASNPQEIDERRAEDDRSTGIGVAVGTPSYMAPEQAEGKPLDARTDIFALGVVLYEAACGDLPFKGRDNRALLDAIRFEQPPPVRASHAKIPSALSRIIAKCLEKSPQNRYASAAALGKELAALTESRVFSAVRGVLPERFPSQIRAPMKWFGAASLLAILSGVVIFSRFSATLSTDFPSGVHRSVLIADFENRTNDPDFDTILDAVLAAQLDQSTEFIVLPSERVKDLLDQMGIKGTLPKIDHELAREASLRGEVSVFVTGEISRLGEDYLITATLWNASENESISIHQERARGKDKVLPALDRMAASMRLSLGDAAVQVRAPQAPAAIWTSTSWEALHLYSNAVKRDYMDDVTGAIDLLRTATEIDPGFGMAFARLGRIYDALGNRYEAIRALESAMKKLDRLTPKEKGFVQGYYYQATDQYEEMLAVLQPLASLYPHDPDVLRSLGTAFLYLGDYQAAANAFRKAVELSPRVLGHRYNLANAYLHDGDYARAAETLDELAAIDPESRFLDHSRGYWHLLQGEFADAVRHFERYAASPDPARRSRGYFHLVKAHLLSGEYQKATVLLQQRVAFSRSRKQPSIEGESILMLGRIALELGRPDEARRHAERALELPLATEEVQMAGEVLARAGFVDAASSVLERLREGPESPTLERLEEQLDGEIRLARGEIEEAIRVLHESMGLTSMPSWSESLARACRVAGDLDAALFEYQRIVSNKGPVLMTGRWGPPLYAEAVFRIGEIHDRLGRLDEARRYFEDYLRLRERADETLASVVAARARLASLHEP